LRKAYNQVASGFANYGEVLHADGIS